MISSNYVSLSLKPRGSPPPLLHVNKDNLPVSFGQRSALVCMAAEEPVHLSEVWGPICTVTSSLVPCLQQEVELTEVWLGFTALLGEYMHVCRGL